MKKKDESIPFFRPDIGNNEVKAVSRLLKNGWLNTGKETKLFEEELEKLFGAHKVFCVSSCWAALYLSLKSYGIGNGDEVITTPYTFVATANCIEHCGAKPVFIDIDKHHIDPKCLKKKINKKTKAILAVDLGGYPANHWQLLEVIKESENLFQPANKIQKKIKRPLLLIDSAHAVGTQLIKKNKVVKSFADIGAYSFHSAKNITTGDGGAIAIFNKDLCQTEENDITFNERLRQYISHGMTRDAYQRESAKNHRYNVKLAGYKLNMTDIEATLGRTQLKKMGSFLKKRNKLIDFYNKSLAKEKLIKHSEPMLDAPKNYQWKIFPHLYMVEIIGQFNSCKQKMEIMKRCREQGVILAEHYVPITSLDIYKNLFANPKEDFTEKILAKKWPKTYELWYRCFSLPLYQTLTKKEAKKIVDTVITTTNKILGQK